MQCPICGRQSNPGEAFCDNCGHALTNATPQVSGAATNSTGVLNASTGPDAGTASAPPAPLAAKLCIDSNGATFDLPPGKLLLVGRLDPIDGIYPDIDLTPHDRDVGVSRRHAELHEQGGQWFVKDLGSTNYTVVNRKRVQPAQEMLLQNGDEIRFARVTAHFQTN